MSTMLSLPPRPLLSINEYCAIIGINRKTFYRQFNKGKLPVRAKRVGAHLMIPTKYVEKLLS